MGCQCNEPNILPTNCPFLENCSNVAVDPRMIDTTGTVIGAPSATIIKVPRFLRRVNLQGVVIDNVTIPEGFSEIKAITRQIIVTQCKLVLNQLLVEGYIVKNIRYVTPNPPTTDTGRCISYRNTYSDIDVKVPISLTMTVPDLPTIFPTPSNNSQFEYNFLCDTMTKQCCDRGFAGPSPCETLRVQSVYLNEVPFCELVGYRIAELDISRKPCPIAAPGPCPQQCCELLYNTLTEKLLVNLIIDLYVLGRGTSATPTTPVPPEPPFTGPAVALPAPGGTAAVAVPVAPGCGGYVPQS